MSNNYSKWLKFKDVLAVVETEFMKTVSEIDPGLSDKKGICGMWSPKDVVAHITGWEKEVVEQFRNFLNGSTSDLDYDINAYNRESVKARQHMSWQQVIKELEKAQKELQQLNNSLNEEKITKDNRFVNWVVVLLKHYKHHTAQLKTPIRKD